MLARGTVSEVLIMRSEALSMTACVAVCACLVRVCVHAAASMLGRQRVGLQVLARQSIQRDLLSNQLHISPYQPHSVL